MLRRDIGDRTALHFTQCDFELCNVTDRFFNLARAEHFTKADWTSPKKLASDLPFDFPVPSFGPAGTFTFCEVVMSGVILIGVFSGLLVFALVYTLASRKL